MVMRFEAHAPKKHYCVVHYGGQLENSSDLEVAELCAFCGKKEVSRSSWRWGASAL